MIEDIYLKVRPEKLLHVIVRTADMPAGRTDAVGSHEFLQAAIIKQPKGQKYKAHRHLWKTGQLNVIAQESWIVVKGKVKAILYDLDNTIIATPELNPGDLSITLDGGHTYEMLEDSLVVEYKTGPYTGQNNDKIVINAEGNSNHQ